MTVQSYGRHPTRNFPWLCRAVLVLIVSLSGCDSSATVVPVDPVLTLSSQTILEDEYGEAHVGNTERQVELVGFFAGCSFELGAYLTHLTADYVEIDVNVRINPVVCITTRYERFSVNLDPLSPGTYRVKMRFLIADNFTVPPEVYEIPLIDQEVTVTRRESGWPL